MQNVLTLLFLTSIIAYTNAIDTRCNFMMANFAGATVLTCFVVDVRESIGCSTPDEMNIVNIRDLPPGRTIKDIEGIFSRNVRWPRFPINLSRQFPNLRAIELDNAGLTSIRSTHFINLNFLIHVSLPGNRFRILHGRLFRFNRNLRVIRFHNNILLINVGFNIIGNLPNLREINFGGIGCAGGNNLTTTNSADFSRIASRLIRLCPPEEDDLANDLDGMECNFDTDKSTESDSSSSD